MAFFPRLLAVLIMVITMTTSCQSASSPDKAQNGSAAATHEIAVKPNPSPKHPYLLRLKFDGLPGKLASLKGTLDFEVANRDCVPIDYERAVGGVKLAPQHSLPVDFRQQDDGSYTATVNADALANEDYYGLGVCEWALNSATVHFHSQATHFVGGIDGKALTSEASIVQHYLVGDFEKKPDAMDFVFGEDSANFYQASAGPQFTLTISAHKE